MRIAVFGDIHGHWLEFREAILRLHDDAPLDLVLQVGDAQPIRNDEDLLYMPVPVKYRHPGNFAQIKEPWPVRTLFIGGNHEPFNVLDQLPNGGALLPNLDYFGRAELQAIGPLRIAGLSGVHSPRAIDRPRHKWPFPPDRAREASYFRREDIARVSAMGRVDILLLHEWPDLMEGARRDAWPKHWEKVGAEPLGELMKSLRPTWVFCGHMHHPEKHKVGPTTIVALDDFSTRPLQAIAVLDGDPLALVCKG